MSWPIAILISVFLICAAFVFHTLLSLHLDMKKAEVGENVERVRADLTIHEQALKNLAAQVHDEISKLKDRVGTMQLQTGMRTKQGEVK